MRWQAQKVRAPLSVWHQWFAWFPVRAKLPNDSRVWVWRETIDRRVTMGTTGAVCEYRCAPFGRR